MHGGVSRLFIRRVCVTVFFLVSALLIRPGLALDRISNVTIGTLAIPALTDTGEESAEAMNERFLQRQYKAVKIHKALAFTTGGLLLAGGAVGAIHFLDMYNRGHKYRDSIGFTEESGNTALQDEWIRRDWRSSRSQTYRILHGALISASVISYTVTATIELTMPRMSRNPSLYSNTHLHKYLFLLHASLMAANMGLGFAESHALSQGNHELVQGLGIAHMVIGVAAPVVMVGSGLAFKLPWD
jgi:hypothetical protein